MKHLPEYTIHSFNWVKEDNTLYGISSTLWDTLGYYQFPFPNDRKQFKVVNTDTDGFRVFTFVTSFENEEGMLEYEFASEDGIKCRILIEPGTAGHTEIAHSNEHWNEIADDAETIMLFRDEISYEDSRSDILPNR
jgi:hypothetical protein